LLARRTRRLAERRLSSLPRLIEISYAIDPLSGKITLLNRESVKGTIPAHLAVDPTGQYLIVANYVGANFVSLPIGADGRLGPVSSEIRDTGRGPNEQRGL
jgi:6-phosphogluconolactonase